MEEKKTNLKLLYIFILFSLASGLIAFASWQTNKSLSSKLEEVVKKQDSYFSVENNIRNENFLSDEEKVIKVSKEVSPAVVSIVATAEVPTFETYYNNPSLGLPEELRPFFDYQIPERRQSGTETIQIGAGTGFIISTDGYIVTNKHVVSDIDANYTVFLNNEDSQGEKIEAEVLARDPSNDLAILKINRDDLPYLNFGDSDNLQVGQTAITIGYALGEFDNTVSKGVISGLARTIVAGSRYSSEELNNLIQTDAAINPGNSGGPMLNLDGEVIGINVAMAQAENIGFAIPSLLAKQAYEEVRETGTIEKEDIAFLGVRYLLINENIQDRNNLPYDYGALVIRGESPEDLAVMPGSPADKAGIVENDIILEVEGERVNLRQPLARLIAKYEPGDEVTFKIYQKGEEKEVVVTLSAM